MAIIFLLNELNYYPKKTEANFVDRCRDKAFKFKAFVESALHQCVQSARNHFIIPNKLDKTYADM